MPSAAHDPIGAETDDVQAQVDRFQRHVEELIENRDEEDVENIKAHVQRAVEKTLLGKKFDGTISGAVEASIKEANRRIDAMLAQEELDEEQDHQDEPAELESNGGKSSSLAGAAAEGFKFIGSFFAQAAMGGAELPELMREEEQAYNAQSICLPLRRLAASASTEAEHDALVGGLGLSSTADAKTAQEHAKEVREAQQDELKKQTGDTLYPASGREEPVTASQSEDPSADNAVDRGAKAPSCAQADELGRLNVPGAPGGLQEEDWSAPGHNGTKSKVGSTEVSDVKGSIGHSAGL
ncbi:hypothetical protein COCOBI_06-2490 [Coccomyxa sp. Obi]|nr:hypothetical protein COCOBI_06-2490 [Coccomyxa sp. Obi]